MLRWLACALHKDALETANEERRDWPESTVLHYFWTAAEDNILHHIIAATLMKSTDHLSLHFDGIMVDDRRANNQAEFQEFIQLYVERNTGFKINFRQKESFSWFAS